MVLQYRKSFLALAINTVVLVILVAQSAWARPSVGLALGGGAARGISHIGLLKAFEEEGIPIDLIVGSSMGSIIAGLYASGLSVDNLIQLVQTVDVTSLFDVKIPLHGSLLNASRFRLFLEQITNHADIADLPIPFYTVLTNLDTGEEHTLHQGPLSRAIHASMAMPVIFPPVEVDGKYYVDGGTKNLVPANVARELGADVVIAVDIKKEVPVESHADLLTNIRLFMQFMFRGYTDAKLSYADILILPKVNSDSYMDYQAVNHLIEEGYQAAKNAMPQIKELLLRQDPELSFTGRVPMEGIPMEKFAQRLDEALALVYDKKSGLALKLDHIELPGPEFTASVSYSLPTFVPLFTKYSYSQQSNPMAAYHTFASGLGKVDSNHLSAHMRKFREDPTWYLGGQFQLDLNESLRLSADWTAQNTAPPQWQVSGKATFDQGPTKIVSAHNIIVGQDPRGLGGVKSNEVYLEAGSEWQFPLSTKSIDVWEVAAIYPAWLLGGSARRHISDNAALPIWHAETGLDAEIRFFGITSLNTRLSLAYQDNGDDNAWSLSFRIGE